MFTITMCLIALGAAPGAELADLWDGLREEDPIIAMRSMWRMSQAPECVEFLKKRLIHDQPIDTDKVDRLIEKLNDEVFSVRSQAESDLIAIGFASGPIMRAHLADQKHSIEMRRRLERILEHVDGSFLSADRLQKRRAIEVLASIDSDEARVLLDSLVKGPNHSYVADAARQIVKTRSSEP